MCLITNKRPQIATEDIVVYKELRSNLCSVFQHFQYELNKLYSTEIKESPTGQYSSFCSIDQCYLYDNYGGGEGLEDAIDCRELTVYQEGFHSISLGVLGVFLEAEGRRENSVTVKCIIPKGATYIEDFVGFIVSNQIMIVERVQGTETI